MSLTESCAIQEPSRNSTIVTLPPGSLAVTEIMLVGFQGNSPATGEVMFTVGGVLAVTLTAIVINAAAEVVFLVSGDAKAAIVRKVLEGPNRPHELPAQLIAPTSGRVLWLLDAPAAAELGKRF